MKLKPPHIPILLSALSIFLTALSSLANSGEKDSFRFTLWTEIRETAPEPMKSLAPSVYQIKAAGNEECTGSFVSKTGLFLTARHCVQKCLIRAGVLRWKVMKESGLNYFEIDPEKLGKAACELTLNGIPQTALIEATSPGLVISMDKRSFRSLYPEMFRDWERAGYTNSGDFALLRLAPPASYSCLSQPVPAAAGELVYTLGYPSATNRPDGHNSDGKSFYASAGRVRSTIAENACFGELTPEMAAKEIAEFEDPHAFISSLDAIFGSSGSAVVNESGQVVGILTELYSHGLHTKRPEDDPKARFCAGSAKALGTPRILELLAPYPNLLNELKCN